MDENEHLRKLYPWLATVARNLNKDHADDLKQVGAIAAWKALQTFDGKRGMPEQWMKLKAQYAMYAYLQNAYGRKPGTKKPGWDIPVEEESLDSSTSDRYDELCYHQKEIAEAVSELPEKQRRYVHLRFWEGYRHSELEPVFGYNPTGLWYHSAKITLRQKLAHLEGAV